MYNFVFITTENQNVLTNSGIKVGSQHFKNGKNGTIL